MTTETYAPLPLVTTLAIGFALGAWLFPQISELTGWSTPRPAKAAPRTAASLAPAVVETTKLSPTEMLQIVTVPDVLTRGVFASRCVLYVNSELKTSSMGCTPQTSIEEHP